MVSRLQDSLADVKKTKMYLNTISETCELILGQIKATLDYNLVNMNMFQPQLKKWNLIADIVKPAVRMFSVQSEMLNLNLPILHKFKEDPQVVIDKVRIQQIIINLVQNSVKYSRHGGTIEIRVEPDSSTDSQSGFCTFNIHVTDQGQGIDK
jgi:signal transduction histidine kinase